MTGWQRYRTNVQSVLGSVVADAIVGTLSYLIAAGVRFDAPDAPSIPPGVIQSLPLVVTCQIGSFVLAGVYSATRRALLPTVLRAVFLSAAAGASATWMLIGFDEISRASFVINALVLALPVFLWRATGILWPLARRSWMPIPDVTMQDRGDRVSRAADSVFSLFRYRHLLKSMIRKELKLKYRGSALGFAWSLLNPLLMVAVYAAAFTYVIGVTEQGFIFRLLVGLLAWGFFANSATMATMAILDNRGLIKSVFFPRTVLPIATVLFNLAQFLLNLFVFIPVMLLIFSVTPGASIWAFPIVLTLHVAFTIGLALALATATTFFRDVRHLVEVGLNVLFWATPIVYSYRQVPDSVRTAVILSPMSPFIVAYQGIFVYREWPSASVWFIAAIYAAAALLFGFVLLATYEERFAEQV